MSQVREDVTVQASREIDIRPLKRLAAKVLPENSTLRHALTNEKDSMPTSEFVAKLGTWLSILDYEIE